MTTHRATMGWNHAILVVGVALCLIGAGLMVHGRVLGEKTTGIATFIGIVGLGTIAGTRKRLTNCQRIGG